MAFYCNGKQGICDCDILCADCKFYDDKGGKEVQTNADRIRAMSDDELAEGLCSYVERFVCRAKRERNEGCSEYGCKDCVLEWLKQPAEVE